MSQSHDTKNLTHPFRPFHHKKDRLFQRSLTAERYPFHPYCQGLPFRRATVIAKAFQPSLPEYAQTSMYRWQRAPLDYSDCSFPINRRGILPKFTERIASIISSFRLSASGKSQTTSFRSYGPFRKCPTEAPWNCPSIKRY